MTEPRKDHPSPREELAREVEGYRVSLQELYRRLDAEVARAGPVCELSGRCCRFEEYDHTLFLSDPEAKLLVIDAPEPVRPLDDGASCPWQDVRGRCTARDARPMGCRVYFCDPSYEQTGPEIAERSIALLKEVVDRMGLSWNYAPLHRHLHRLRSEGIFVDPQLPGG